jgi:hypothetical protein
MTLCSNKLSSIVPLIETCRVRVCNHHMKTAPPNCLQYVILLINIDTHEMTRRHAFQVATDSCVSCNGSLTIWIRTPLNPFVGRGLSFKEGWGELKYIGKAKFITRV